MKVTYELNRSTAKSRSLKGGNEMMSSNDRLHPHIRAELTNHLRKLSTETALQVLSQQEHIMFSKENRCYVFITVCPPTRRRMDSPNWYPTVKALIDGLTDACVFEDDNDKIIKGYFFRGGEVTGNKKYRIELDIRREAEIQWPI